jgi:hypothetical protein
MMRRRRMPPTSLGPGDLEQVTSGAPEDVKISRMRVAAQRLLHLQPAGPCLCACQSDRLLATLEPRSEPGSWSR